jgi:hypothetical protein
VKEGMDVRHISRMECAPFILGIHYAKRWPPISYRFGLFVDGLLEGVVTYGVPSSAPLRNGIAGKEFSVNVLELNRLCLKSNERNHASFLVSSSLRMLKRLGDFIVVSYADTEQGHKGYVYQACNFAYYGLSAKRTDWKIRGMEHLHGQTIADKFRGKDDRAAAIRAEYGDDFYLLDRPRKHRYIYLCGSKSFRKAAGKAIKYSKEPYPK